MIEADRLRGVEAVEVNQLPPGGGVDEPRAVAAGHVEHELEAVHQDVLFEFGDDKLRRNGARGILRCRLSGGSLPRLVNYMHRGVPTEREPRANTNERGCTAQAKSGRAPSP